MFVLLPSHFTQIYQIAYELWKLVGGLVFDHVE